MFPEVRVGYMVSAAIWAVFITVPNWITFAFTREVHFTEDRPKGPGYLEGLKIAFRNRAFVLVTLIYLLSWLSIQFVQTNLILYVRYWMGAEAQFGPLILAVQFSSFVFVLIWTRVSKKAGKQRTYYIGMGVWIVVCLGLFFVQPGQMPLLFLLAILAGAGVSIGYIIPWSMIPDVIEQDELETGQRREGVFYGFFVFMQKLGLSLGLAISNFILEAAGYITPVPGRPGAGPACAGAAGAAAVRQFCAGGGAADQLPRRARLPDHARTSCRDPGAIGAAEAGHDVGRRAGDLFRRRMASGDRSRHPQLRSRMQRRHLVDPVAALDSGCRWR